MNTLHYVKAGARVGVPARGLLVRMGEDGLFARLVTVRPIRIMRIIRTAERSGSLARK